MESINLSVPSQFAQAQLRNWHRTETKSLTATPNLWLKRGIWAYFYLLIFEGALRKWVLPDLSTPLLVIRDPIAVWLIFKAIQKGLIKSDIYLVLNFFVGFLGFFTAIFFGHGNIIVASYGFRIFLLHFPLIFVIGSVFDRSDVIKMGQVLLFIAIPMTILTGYQFTSPQTAWVNRGVGTDTNGAGFSGALGYFRPPGTFSFTVGNSCFFSMVAAFVFYFLFNSKEINKLILYAASVALLFSVPFSISRTLVFQVGISIAFAMFTTMRNPKYIATVILATVGLAVVVFFLQDQPLFAIGIKVINARFDNASQTEGGVGGTLQDRFIGSMALAIQNSGNHAYWGEGMGYGTQVGSLLLTGNTGFLTGEIEWARLIGEMGFLLGLSAILVRIFFTIKLFSQSIQKLFRKGDMLPWMLLSFATLQLVQGQWGQPTLLGFAVVGGGLIVAALKPDITRRTV